MTRIPVLALLLLAACGGESKTSLGVTANDEVTRTCSRAYGSLTARVDKIVRERGLKQRPQLPSREAFVASCSKLPIEAARCMDPVRRAANAEACAKAFEGVSPELKAEIEKMLRTPGSAEQAPAQDAQEGSAAEQAPAQDAQEGSAAEQAPAQDAQEGSAAEQAPSGAGGEAGQP